MKLGTQGFVGARLKEARQSRGITAISLATILGVTRAAVSQYESDLQSPRPEIMDHICACLRFPEEFFTKPRTERDGAIYWRNQASTTETARKAAKWKLNWLQDMVEYFGQYVDFPTVDFPAIDVPSDPLKLTGIDIENIATAVRKYWGLGDGPLPSVMTLLENNGVFISRDDLYVPSIDGLSRWSKGDQTPFCIVAAGKCSAARTNMDLLHELGHLILHRELDQRYVAMPLIHKVIEKQAFAFAGAFALPGESFSSDLYSLSIDSFIRLKRRWRISIAAMIKRCDDLGVTSESQSDKLSITLSTRGWRTEEPLDDEIPVEQPQSIANALDIVVREGIRTKEQIISDLSLPPDDIESVCGLARGSLNDKPSVVSIVQATDRHDKPKPTRGTKATVLDFSKRGKKSN